VYGSRLPSCSAVAFSLELLDSLRRRGHEAGSCVVQARQRRGLLVGAGAGGVETEPGGVEHAGNEGTSAEATAHPPRLRVPPPPGGRSRRRGRRVRAGDDPFIAAYLACTGGRNARQKPVGWAGHGFGNGLGLSCKSSCEAVQESMVMATRAKIPPKFKRNG
jgi:hypothetical protein